MPEYETIFALGSMLDNADKGSIVKANELCDQFGLDTISLGVTLPLPLNVLKKVYWAGPYGAPSTLVTITPF